MSFLPITLGIQVEGLSFDADVAAARVWAYRRWIVLGDPEQPEEWKDNALDRLPQGVQSSVDPLLGRFDNASFVFELAGKADALTMFAAQGYAPFTALTADLDSTSTDVPIATAGLANKVVYVGRETIRLGTEAPGGYENCERGWHDSYAKAHTVGTGVFSLPPRFRRQVWIVVWDPVAKILRRRWTGFLDDWETNDTLSKIQLRCSEFFSSIMKQKVGSGEDLSRYGQIRYDSNGGLAFSGVLKTQPSVTKADTSRWIALQVGEALVVGYYDSDEGTITLDRATPELGSVEASDASDVAKAGQPFDGKIFEPFVISQELEALYPGISPTSSFWSPFNRTATALALLTSTLESSATVSPRAAGYVDIDVLGAKWGLGLDGQLDRESWDRHVYLSEEKPLIDELILGWDGKKELVFDATNNKLLRPFGLFYALSEDGLLGIASFGSLDVRDYCEAQSNGVTILPPSRGGILKMEGNSGSAIGKVTAIVGELPWREPSTLTILAPGLEEQYTDIADPREVTYDLSTISRAKLSELSDGDNADQILLELLDSVALTHAAMPLLTVRVRDSRLDAGLNFSHGRKISLLAGLPEDARIPVPNASGFPELLRPQDALTEDQKVRLVGTIVSRDYITEDQTFVLTVLLTSFQSGLIARLRAPNAKVTGTIPAENKLLIPTESVFGLFSGSDTASLRAGDEIELWQVDGQKWADSEVREILGLDEDHVVLDGWYVSDPASATKQLYIRLASSAVYDNDAHVACFPRPWVYLAGDGDELNELGSTVNADKYG